MTRLNSVNPDTAEGRAKDLFDAAKKKMAGVPNILRVMANQPAVLDMYFKINEALSGGSFDAPTREAVALATAGENSCEYCAAAHTAISKGLKVDAAEIKRRIEGQSEDSRVRAILDLAKRIIETKGFVSDEDLENARKAGLSDGDIMETVGNVALNFFTNYVNHVADTDIDFPKVELKNSNAA